MRALLLLFALLVAAPAAAQTFPPLSGRVVDQANLLSPEQEAQLTQRLEALEGASSRQLVVATVRAAAAQERNVLREVTEARASASRINVTGEQLTDPAAMNRFAAAQQQLTLSLQRLQEAYPELRTNENFLTLQSQLEGTENRITVARRDYNSAVQAYNTEIRTFPGVIGARVIYGSQPMAPFQAEEAAQRAPTVNFGNQQ